MITREALNMAVGSFVDAALTTAGLPAKRRKSDDMAQIDRRSVQIQLGELYIDPMGDMRRCSQSVIVCFYPEEGNQYRDEIWGAVNALEAALESPVVVDGVELYADDEGIVADMTTEVLEITFTLTWIELKDIGADTDTEKVDMLETLVMGGLKNGISTGN